MRNERYGSGKDSAQRTMIRNVRYQVMPHGATETSNIGEIGMVRDLEDLCALKNVYSPVGHFRGLKCPEFGFDAPLDLTIIRKLRHGH